MEFYLNQLSSVKLTAQQLEEIAAFLKATQEAYPSLKESEAHLHLFRQLVGSHEGDSLYCLPSAALCAAQVYHAVYSESIYQTGRNQIIVSRSDTPYLRFKAHQFERLGCVCKEVPLNQKGQITLDALKSMITPRTSLISISWANPVTGVIHPIWDIAALCEEKGILLHVDASAVIGRLFFRFQDLPIDYLTVEGKALGSPVGGALLFAKKRAPMLPITEGDRSERSQIMAMGFGADTLSKQPEETLFETIGLRDYFERSVSEAIPGAQILFSEVERLPHMAVIAFPEIHAEALLFMLAQQGIWAQIGGSEQESLEEALLHCGFEGPVAQSALSFALSNETQNDVEQIVTTIATQVKKLQALAGEKRA